MISLLAAALACTALCGCLYLTTATVLVGRFAKQPLKACADAPAVTILKPLHGAEPGLEACLETFCRQNYAGPIQIVFGVQDSADPATAVVRALVAQHPDLTIDLMIDATQHGANRKASNLINMMACARHGVIVLADSDMQVDPGYLARVIGALQQLGVGAVTCLYVGLPAGPGLVPRLSALAIDTHFLPNVIVGLSLGLAKPCFGSTIALRRETLKRIGGFEAIADDLADDYAVGAAVRRLGLTVAVPAFAIGHLCPEPDFKTLWSHELRWARTVRSVDPGGHLGSAITHPLPFALVAAALDFGPLTAATLAAAVACRIALAMRVERAFALAKLALWLLPMRDLLSSAVFVASFSGRSITWKGRRYSVVPDGTLVPNRRPPPP